MIRTVIVEDEGVAARKLQAMLEKEGMEVIASLKSNRALQNFMSSSDPPDLYFMDIHLSDGIVFETLQSLTIKTPIIFTTAYDEFAIRAFKQNSVDYLLKPVDKTELKAALAKFNDLFQKEPQVDLNAAISQLLNNHKEDYRERIKVKVGDRLRSIKIEEAALFYSESKITFVLTAVGRAYPIDQSLEQISGELDPKRFHRVNRSQIVNIDFIDDVIAYSNSRLKVLLNNTTDHEIIVARERVKGFKAWLG